MYRIDPQSNRIAKLRRVSFSELGFTERNHLQEWLANQPDALGEELLIIQKEFDGFDDTKERLDLLAIDKAGALVIIENKLDDSGRNVVWQSLKSVPDGRATHTAPGSRGADDRHLGERGRGAKP